MRRRGVSEIIASRIKFRAADVAGVGERLGRYDMKELDLVMLLRDYPEFGLQAGAIGAVVHEHVEIEGLPKTFMVEFSGPDAPYDSIVEDIAATHLRLATEEELAARRLTRLGSSDPKAEGPPRRRPA